jgi:molybdate transport repressor ModE-like protein
MKQIAIRPTWTIQDPQGPTLSTRLIELLVQVHEQGSLLTAAKEMSLSYRHAWDLVRQAQDQFKAPLLNMERGKGSTLTPLAEKIVWADHRIGARLKPVLDSLASELAAELRRALNEAPTLLRVHASHGFAIEQLIERLTRDGLSIEFTYGSSSAAVAALHDGDCDAAGFHIPMGPMQQAALAHYSRWLSGEELTIIDIATRRQGLMVRAGNPKEVFALSDLARGNVRFINRNVGSGTRLLLEGLLRAQDIDPSSIAGFEQGEYTHAAVAAYVASGMADVGFGLEPPARHFKLDFVPIASERYFLLCRNAVMDSPAIQIVVRALRNPEFRQVLDSLPGYDATIAGNVMPLVEGFPSLANTL